MPFLKNIKRTSVVQFMSLDHADVYKRGELC
jgi:hypothetical protein